MVADSRTATRESQGSSTSHSLRAGESGSANGILVDNSPLQNYPKTESYDRIEGKELAGHQLDLYDSKYQYSISTML